MTLNTVSLRFLAWVWVLALLASANAYSQTDTASEGHPARTLVIASHPYPERSVVNKALQQVVQNMDGVVYRNLESLYGNDVKAIDVEAERKAYEDVDTVVYMFPVHWFNMTPMLKAYFNEVWFRWAPQALKGKKMLVVVTAAGSDSFYSRTGELGITIDEILAPMRACARFVGMSYLEPLAFLDVAGADAAKIQSYQKQLQDRLKEGGLAKPASPAKADAAANRVLVSIVLLPKDIPHFAELLAKEKATAAGWKDRGILEHLLSREDGHGVMLVLKDVSRAQAEVLVKSLPLSRYFDKVEYSPYLQQY
ncbi:NAD(P)H-dependent oxidoreductase [Niveibacterium terrae]|uniref:NAD(P)H-dependent oxidoreductase n=1 Tax=Niveibacterium terrae TaxID=3373598 RepID=UPI003A90F5A2